jgi:hypothetical protein
LLLTDLSFSQFVRSLSKNLPSADFTTQNIGGFIEKAGYWVVSWSVFFALELVENVRPHIVFGCGPYANGRTLNGHTGRSLAMRRILLELDWTRPRMLRLIVALAGGSFLIAKGRELANRDIQPIRPSL